ncbi:hypothetical protein CHS0354_033424 [Potamilus streckersoni]|uniref:Uncharacterized protein n=1 Tax=Potamilus streckersoni TaxID=2493646 RepID=A0AAE0SG83_9BIVA|nr:hypothetical protein CHS0354_033424 [Potamilus streckersoni]
MTQKRDIRNDVLADATENIAVIQNGPRDRSNNIPIVRKVAEGDDIITVGGRYKAQKGVREGNSNVPAVASDDQDAQFCLYDSDDDDSVSDDEAEEGLKSGEEGSIAMENEEETIKVLTGKNMYGDKRSETSPSFVTEVTDITNECNENESATQNAKALSGAYDNVNSCTTARLDLDSTGTSNCHISQEIIPISKIGIIKYDTSHSEQTRSESRTFGLFNGDGGDNNDRQSEKSFSEYSYEKTIGHDVKVYQPSYTENIERDHYAELCQTDDLNSTNGTVEHIGISDVVTELPMSTVYDTNNTNSGADKSLVGEKFECRNIGDSTFGEQARRGDKQLATSPPPVQEGIRNITYGASVEDYLDSGIKVSRLSEIQHLPKIEGTSVCTGSSLFHELSSSSRVGTHKKYHHRDEEAGDKINNFVDSSVSCDRSCQVNETRKTKCIEHQFVHSSRTFLSSEFERGDNNLHSDNAAMPGSSSISSSYERKKAQFSQDRSSSVVCNTDKMLYSSENISENSEFNSKAELTTVSTCVKYSQKNIPSIGN